MINEKCSHCKEKKAEGINIYNQYTCLDCLEYSATCEHIGCTSFICVYMPQQQVNQYICVKCFFKNMLGFN